MKCFFLDCFQNWCEQIIDLCEMISCNHINVVQLFFPLPYTGNSFIYANKYQEIILKSHWSELLIWSPDNKGIVVSSSSYKYLDGLNILLSKLYNLSVKGILFSIYIDSISNSWHFFSAMGQFWAFQTLVKQAALKLFWVLQNPTWKECSKDYLWLLLFLLLLWEVQDRN